MDILLIEDEADNAWVLRRLLWAEGHKVEVAISCADAIELYRRNFFDVVLCDIGLPDGDGNELLERLLAIRDVKAIAITGYGMEEDVAQSMAAGFIVHLAKPVDLGELCTLLDDIELGKYDFPFFETANSAFCGPHG